MWLFYLSLCIVSPIFVVFLGPMLLEPYISYYLDTMIEDNIWYASLLSKMKWIEEENVHQMQRLLLQLRQEFLQHQNINSISLSTFQPGGGGGGLRQYILNQVQKIWIIKGGSLEDILLKFIMTWIGMDYFEYEIIFWIDQMMWALQFCSSWIHLSFLPKFHLWLFWIFITILYRIIWDHQVRKVYEKRILKGYMYDGIIGRIWQHMYIENVIENSRFNVGYSLIKNVCFHFILPLIWTISVSGCVAFLGNIFHVFQCTLGRFKWMESYIPTVMTLFLLVKMNKFLSTIEQGLHQFHRIWIFLLKQCIYESLQDMYYHLFIPMYWIFIESPSPFYHPIIHSKYMCCELFHICKFMIWRDSISIDVIQKVYDY